jgi:prefoldin beta subunit
MAEPLRNPNELQKQLSEFQDVQRQLQMIAAQKQQIIFQIEELKVAEEQLAKAEKGIYRYVGTVLIETTKTEAASDIKEKKDLFEMRLSMLDKQEAKLKPRFVELRDSLEKALKENRTR